MDLQAFAEVAPYLTHPLTLVGFVLLLFFGVHRALIRSGSVPRVDKTAAPSIVKLFLSYGFAIAVLIVVAGFALRAWENGLEAEESAGPKNIRQETHGDASPPVADTEGDVTITIEGQPAHEEEAAQ